MYSQEIINAQIHGIAIGLSIAALVILLTLGADDVWQRVSYAIYGSSLIILFSMSTIYHSISINPQASKKMKDLFHRLDHAAIYLLIAGTYTPFTLGVIRWWRGWSLFGVVWWLAIIWIVTKLFFFKEWNRKLSAILYIIMWWLFVIALPIFFAKIPTYGMMWLFIWWGIYTLGTYFYINRKITYAHALWHLFVLAGSVCHFLGIYWYV